MFGAKKVLLDIKQELINYEQSYALSYGGYMSVERQKDSGDSLILIAAPAFKGAV